MLAGGLLVAGGAEANLVGVDFGSNPNPTPQNWTATNGSAPLTNLQNDSGTPTSVGLSFDAPPSSFGAIAQPSTVPSYTYSLSDISYNIYSFGSSLTMTLSGLTPGQSYPVYVFGLRGGQSYSQTITMTGANTVSFTQAANSDQLTVNDQLGSNSSNLSAYAKTITADSNGNIQVVTGPGYFLAGLAIDVPVPTATTSAATSITTTGATLNGTVNDNGAATTVNFNYGTTVSYGSSATATQSPVASGTGSTSVSAPLTGLTCNTLYHFRVSATNSVNTTNGSDATFTTSACPGPTTPTNVVATAGQQQISVAFGASTGTGTISYTATCTSTSQGAASPRSATGSSSPIIVTGTTAGASYTCSVVATDSNGSSNAASANGGGSVTPTAPPTPSPEPIPTLSQWAEISMMFLMILTVGWYGRRLKQR